MCRAFSGGVIFWGDRRKRDCAVYLCACRSYHCRAIGIYKELENYSSHPIDFDIAGVNPPSSRNLFANTSKKGFELSKYGCPLGANLYIRAIASCDI